MYALICCFYFCGSWILRSIWYTLCGEVGDNKRHEREEFRWQIKAIITFDATDSLLFSL
jgi:hypothetical protein